MSVQGLQSTTAQHERDERYQQMARLVKRLRNVNRVGLGVLWAVATLVALIFIAIIVYLVIEGFGYLLNASFYGSTDPASIGPELFNTIYILILTEIFLFPIGL